MAARKPFTVKLWEADGKQHRWTIVFRPLPAKNGRTWFGDCDWENREVIINSRLRNPKTINSTIVHEANHVALGVNATEWAVEAVEENYNSIRSALDAN